MVGAVYLPWLGMQSPSSRMVLARLSPAKDAMAVAGGCLLGARLAWPPPSMRSLL